MKNNNNIQVRTRKIIIIITFARQKCVVGVFGPWCNGLKRINCTHAFRTVAQVPEGVSSGRGDSSAKNSRTNFNGFKKKKKTKKTHGRGGKRSLCSLRACVCTHIIRILSFSRGFRDVIAYCFYSGVCPVLSFYCFYRRSFGATERTRARARFVLTFDSVFTRVRWAVREGKCVV